MPLKTQVNILKQVTAILLLLGLAVPGCAPKTGDDKSPVQKTEPKKTEEAVKTEEKTEEPAKTEEKTEEKTSAKGESYLPPAAPSSEDLAIEELKKIGGKAEKNRNGNVDKVDLAGAEIQDGHLVILQAFPFLDTLDLSGTPITDEGLKHLKGLEYLRYLFLLSTDVTDAGVAELKGHSRLEWLCLDDTKVTDAGVKHLEGFGRMVMLHLVTRGDITDACIDSLLKLKELREIKIEGTKITQDGRARLQKALPEIEFIGAGDEGIPID